MGIEASRPQPQQDQNREFRVPEPAKLATLGGSAVEYISAFRAEHEGNDLKLDLNRYGLTAIPAEAVALGRAVRHLDMAYNRIDKFPDALAELSELESLSFLSNYLFGTEDKLNFAVLRSMNRLSVLNLSRNNIQSLPDNLPVSLTRLIVRNNGITRLPENFCKRMTSLEVLDLAECLIGKLPEDLGLLGALKELYLQYNFLTDLPASICDLARLTVLDVHAQTYIMTALPENIGNLTALNTLIVSELKLEGLPASLANLQNLTSLNISVNKWNEVPAVITSLRQLYTFDMYGFMVRALPAGFEGMTNLRRLNLRWNQFYPELPDAIFDLVNLVSLDIAGNDTFILSPRIGNLRALELLDLSFNKYEQLPLDVLCGMPELKRVIAHNTPFLTSLPARVITAYWQGQQRPQDLAGQGAGLPLAPQLTRYDRVKGLIFGQALGDAVGLLTEFLNKPQASTHYGAGPLTFAKMIRDRHRRRWQPGDWTDDTDQMLLILENLVSHGNGSYNYQEFAASLLSWAHRGFSELGDSAGLGIGSTVSSVLMHTAFLHDCHKAAVEVTDASGGRAAANGAVMRTAVVAVPYNNRPDDLLKATRDFCLVTHADPRCLASCVAITTALSAILSGEHNAHTEEGRTAIRKASFEAGAKELAGEASNTQALRSYINDSLPSFELDHAQAIGYTFKAMGAGFAMLDVDDFERGISMITMEAGDADTNGAVAGAILGAKVGYSNLPQHWLDGLVHGQWLADKVDALCVACGIPRE